MSWFARWVHTPKTLGSIPSCDSMNLYVYLLNIAMTIAIIISYIIKMVLFFIYVLYVIVIFYYYFLIVWMTFPLFLNIIVLNQINIVHFKKVVYIEKS